MLSPEQTKPRQELQSNESKATVAHVMCRRINLTKHLSWVSSAAGVTTNKFRTWLENMRIISGNCVVDLEELAVSPSCPSPLHPLQPLPVAKGAFAY